MVIADRANIFCKRGFRRLSKYSGSIIFAWRRALHIADIRWVFGLYGHSNRQRRVFRRAAVSKFQPSVFSKSVAEFLAALAHNVRHHGLRTMFSIPSRFQSRLWSFSRFAKEHLNEFLGSLVPASFALFFTWFGIGFWHGARLEIYYLRALLLRRNDARNTRSRCLRVLLMPRIKQKFKTA